jgi:GTPase SAR1 family protein
MLNGKNYVLKLIDTAGQEDYERVRRLFYKDAKAFILCYSIENRASFSNINSKWMPELKHIDHWPIPFILVGKKLQECLLHLFFMSFLLLGTKIDLRDDPTCRKPLISTEEGEGLAQQISANRFIECSAKKNVHIKDTIEEALRAVFNGPIVENKKKDSCLTCCQS